MKYRYDDEVDGYHKKKLRVSLKARPNEPEDCISMTACSAMTHKRSPGLPPRQCMT